MNKFFSYLQPTIIQATMDEELPERVRGRFFVNLPSKSKERLQGHSKGQSTRLLYF